MAETRLLNENWRFYSGDAPDADYMGYDDRAWQKVTLPHDWAVGYPFDKKHSSGTGYLPGGRGWYRGRFTLTDEDLSKRLTLGFDGVYQHTRVWLNSNYLGAWAYGYTAFSFDVTPFARAGENVISVAVEHDEVADSRWYTGSGIYRDVLLTLSHPDAFLPDGLFVTTKELTTDGAVLEITYQTENADGAAFWAVDGDGNAVFLGEAAGKDGRLTAVLPAPRLWSPETPNLYRLVCTAKKDGKKLDRVEVPFGVRVCRFDADEGFFLNGKPMKIKGVCLHHDGGCLGAAVPKAAWERRLRKLKAAGVNAVRTAHNPPDRHLLDLCDEMGFFVMDEAFDEWEGPKNKWWQGHNVYPPKRFGYAFDFPQWHEKDLTSMVKRDRGHPSVILWSIGNEIDYPNDPYVTPLFREALGNNDAGKPAEERKYDDKKPDAKRLPTVAKRLTEIVHRLDPTRPVLTALSFPELSNKTGLSDVTDIAGYNYRERMYDGDHREFPARIILGSENGHAPAAWYDVLDRSFIAAQFLWTGSDFLGECRGWPERASGAGLLDLAGNEKPLYMQRKALWTKEPFVRLASQRGEDRGVWHDRFLYDGDENGPVSVSAYTNEPEAELFLNGVSLGKRSLTRQDGCRATWTFPYKKGTLTVQTPNSGDTLASPEKAAELRLCPFPCVFSGESVKAVDVTLLDRDGHPAAGDDRALSYAFVGDGEILGIENGRGDDLTPYLSRERRTNCGRAVVYVRANGRGTLFVYTKDGALSASLKF